MTLAAIDRRSEILAHSRALLRTRGFNAFSHRDLAALAGVKSSSVHYHFPSKEDLGLAVIEQYRTEVLEFLQSLEALAPESRLDRFFSVFADSASLGDQWCVAGMLASDFGTVGEPLQLGVRRFFSDVEAWLAVQARLLRPALKPAAAARLGKNAMALLEGALLLARSQGEPRRVEYAAAAIRELFGVD